MEQLNHFITLYKCNINTKIISRYKLDKNKNIEKNISIDRILLLSETNIRINRMIKTRNSSDKKETRPANRTDVSCDEVAKVRNSPILVVVRMIYGLVSAVTDLRN